MLKRPFFARYGHQFIDDADKAELPDQSRFRLRPAIEAIIESSVGKID